MIRFVSKTHSNVVIITPGRVLTDPLSGNPGQIIPQKAARFRHGAYTAPDKETSLQLLKLIEKHQERGMVPTFWVHPEDEARANELWQESQSPAGMQVDVAGPEEQLQAALDRMSQLEDENAELRRGIVNGGKPSGAGRKKAASTKAGGSK